MLLRAAQRCSAAAIQHYGTTPSIAANLGRVQAAIEAQAARCRLPRPPRLVAVSKWQPAERVRAAYDAGHRRFGENYVQELCDKAPLLPQDIQWHFVGHLQSNKAKQLVEGCPNLVVVESVDSLKLADKLNAAAAATRQEPLAVYVQVNSSGEPSKSGVSPGDEVALAQHIVTKCPHLRFAGLMTIGMADYTCRPENMRCLQGCRRRCAAALGVPEADLELSMGMSADFEEAIALGSTNVRVGSTIFGPRPAKGP